MQTASHCSMSKEILAALFLQFACKEKKKEPGDAILIDCCP